MLVENLVVWHEQVFKNKAILHKLANCINISELIQYNFILLETVAL